MKISVDKWHALFESVDSRYKGLYDEYCRLRGIAGTISARIMDATRMAYDKLTETLEAVSGEAAELWDEVRELRGVVKQQRGSIDLLRDALEIRGERITNLNAKLDEARHRSGDLKHGLEDAREAYRTRDAEACKLQTRVNELTADNETTKKAVTFYADQLMSARYDIEMLRGRSPVKVPTYPQASSEFTSSDGAPCFAICTDVLEKLHARIKELYDETKEPVTYGIDVARKEDSHTVITVKKGDKILHVIDVTRLEQEAKTRDIWQANFKSLMTYRSVWRNTYGSFAMQLQNLPKPETSPAHKTQQETRARYEEWQRAYRSNTLSRHNTSWSDTDDAQLLEHYREGVYLSSIAVAAEREWEAVLYRLSWLAKWPSRLRHHPDFLNRAWRWFFRPDGSPKTNRVLCMTADPTPYSWYWK